MSLRIAVSGKGGVGKTTVAGILARLYGREGKEVLVIDADPASNLASSIGVDREVALEVEPLSRMLDLIEERTGVRPGGGYGGIFKMNPKVDDLAERFSIEGKDGVRLLVLGTIKAGGEGCFCPESALLRNLMKYLVLEEDQYLIMDMEAGLEHLGRGSSRYMDVMIIVVEPGMRSVDIALTIRDLAGELGIRRVVGVINKVFSSEAAEKVKETLEDKGIPVMAIIPLNNRLVEADLMGMSAMDLDGTEDVVEAIELIKDSLES
jgi:CO dehydrogenase maturation factor